MSGLGGGTGRIKTDGVVTVIVGEKVEGSIIVTGGNVACLFLWNHEILYLVSRAKYTVHPDNIVVQGGMLFLDLVVVHGPMKIKQRLSRLAEVEGLMRGNGHVVRNDGICEWVGHVQVDWRTNFRAC